MSLSNKKKSRLKARFGDWAIVTGATSGIGFELAKNLADAQFNLIIVSRNEQRLKNTGLLLQQKNIQVKLVIADLSESDGIDEIIKASEGLNVGLLINNAGFGTSGLFVHSSLRDEVNLLRVNCESVLMLSHYFAQQFKQQQRGGIIFLSSLVAFQGVPYAANYAASKAYIQSFAEALALEMKPFHVDVLAAVPGPVSSGFGLRANMKMNNAIPPHKIAAPILSALGHQTSVIPDMFSKFLIYSLRTVPRSIKIRIMQKVMGGFTRHQRN